MPEINVTGRIVYGNPLKSRPKTDVRTKQPILKDGKPVEQWSFGLAVPKSEFGPVWAIMAAEAAREFPTGIPPNFAYKYKDGDGVDHAGKPFNTREGYAGHYVISISQEFAIPCFMFGNGAYTQINTGIKTGDYVQVKLNIVGHKAVGGPQNTPGLYINPNGVLFVGYGTEIVSGADPEDMFGAAPPPVPAGASATPIAPAGMPPMPGGTPTVPGAVPPGMPPVGSPPMPGSPPATAYPSSVPPMPGAPPVTPAHDFVHAATGAPPMPGQTPPPPAPTPPTPPAPPPAPVADPNVPVHQGYNPQTGKHIWKLPATGQVWEA